LKRRIQAGEIVFWPDGRKGYFIGPGDEFSDCILRMAKVSRGCFFRMYPTAGVPWEYLEKRIWQRYNEIIVYEGIIRAGYGVCSAEEHFAQRISAGWIS
jgi:hypothetical protein